LEEEKKINSGFGRRKKDQQLYKISIINFFRQRGAFHTVVAKV
jgi:hypothetical protein